MYFPSGYMNIDKNIFNISYLNSIIGSIVLNAVFNDKSNFILYHQGI